MKLLAFRHHGHEQIGVRLEAGILPLASLGLASDLPATIDELLRNPSLLESVRSKLAQNEDMSAQLVAESDVEVLPCLAKPGKIICIGLNYRRHAEETNMPIPTTPIVFGKFSDAVAAHLDVVPLPKQSKQVDYEAELCIVIGTKAENVRKEDALRYVFGYCNANDVSARDLQMRTSQWLLGKTCAKFAPIGPYLVTADEVENPNDLRIQAFVNGRQVQNSNTSDMIFRCDELIAYLSQHMTLEPGDIILTGTPEGVILGLPESERQWLQAGDEVSIQIEKLGVLTNYFGHRT